MSSKTDYYKVLGVDKTATDEQIKDAYKTLAKIWHPDKNPHRLEEATRKFGEISEAYAVLKDPMKRKTYDNFGFAGIDGADAGQGAEGMPFGFDPFSMFKDFFQKENDIPEVQVTVRATLEELYTGVKKKVKYERYTLCKDCKGKGCMGENVDCKMCNGKGSSIQRTPIGIIQSQCRGCGGKGVDPKAPKCKTCKAVGCYKEEHTLNIQIPKGSSEKHPIILENEGNEIPENERNDRHERSNVIVIISEISHQKYSRGTVIKEIGKVNENNLLIEVKLTLEEALCGFEKTFTHLDGKHFTFSMSETVRHGDIFVMKGYGMPYFNDEQKKGDLIVKLSVESVEISHDKKAKLWKLLSNEPYVEIKKSSSNLINYNDYKVEMVQKDKTENMKNKYHRRGRPGDDDIDDDNNGHAGPPQCAQQ